MKKFSFRFETVLKVKERKEEELKRQLMNIIGRKIEQEKILEDTKQKKAAKNWEELQKFKDEIIRIEELKENLKKEANAYEL